MRLGGARPLATVVLGVCVCACAGAGTGRLEPAWLDAGASSMAVDPGSCVPDTPLSGTFQLEGGTEPGTGRLLPPDSLWRALHRYAPLIVQELSPGAERFDLPGVLDADGSGSLADDADPLLAATTRSAIDDEAGAPEVALYAAGASRADRLFLLYVLYYPLDWSGRPSSPTIDHRGDLEGALVVLSPHSPTADAVVTYAHKLYYLWLPQASEIRSGGAERSRVRSELPASASGGVAFSPGGRAVLFAETGGHGLYSFGRGRWTPQGGKRYPRGPAGVALDRLLLIDVRCDAETADLPSPLDQLRRAPAKIRPLGDLRRFEDGRSLGGLPRGASAPWWWADRRGGVLSVPGQIVRDPQSLYALLLESSRP